MHVRAVEKDWYTNIWVPEGVRILGTRESLDAIDLTEVAYMIRRMVPMATIVHHGSKP